jgi:hypothetical protein
MAKGQGLNRQDAMPAKDSYQKAETGIALVTGQGSLVTGFDGVDPISSHMNLVTSLPFFLFPSINKTTNST